MKFRSRVAAVAAAAGLAAGLLTIGGGTAHAATVLVNCDKVAGTGSVKPALNNAAQDVAIAVKATTVPRTCTGSMAAIGGPLSKMTGKLLGSGTCNLVANPPITDPNKPLAGKITLTYTNLTPLLKPYASTTFIRVGQGTNALLPDEIAIKNGIVEKGVAVGADVVGSILFAPTQKGLVNQSFIDANGNIVAGPDSATLGANCISGTATIATIIFGTDGTGLLGTPLDSSLTLQLP